MNKKARSILESLPGLIMLGIVGFSVGTAQNLRGADQTGLHKDVLNGLGIEASTRNLALEVLEVAGPDVQAGLRIATEAAFKGEICLNEKTAARQGDANTDF